MVDESDNELIEEVLDVEVAEGSMAVLRKRPAGRAVPSVVMFHDGPGIRGATHDFARLLASAGYDVIIPDLYHRHGRMIGYELHEREADPTLVDKLWSMLDTLDDEDIQADLDATLDATGFGLRQQLATIGFCVGARAVLRTMTRRPDQFAAGAMWHPSFLCDDGVASPHHQADQLTGGLFVGIGGDDQLQPIEVHRAFLDAVEPLDNVDVVTYPGADHGYTWRGWPSYHEHAATDSFARTIDVFERHLAHPGERPPADNFRR